MVGGFSRGVGWCGWLGIEKKFQYAFIHKLFMGYAVFVQGLSSQFHADDAGIRKFGTMCDNDQFGTGMMTGIKFYGDFVEHRSRERVFGGSGTERIETHHGENGPCRQGTGIIVAWQSVGPGREMSMKDFPGEVLGAPCFTFHP